MLCKSLMANIHFDHKKLSLTAYKLQEVVFLSCEILIILIFFCPFNHVKDLR